MKFEKIIETIEDMINERYKVDNGTGFYDNLLYPEDETIKNKQIIRIKRSNIAEACWKTMVFVELECYDQTELKAELKNVINWIALLKQCLIGTENVDLYLFLAFTNYSNHEECLRIESTEEICRKYVLMPDEKIEDFLNRTFLHRILEDRRQAGGQDPIEKAFRNTNKELVLINEESQKKWIDYFFKYSGNELAEKLICEG